MGNEKDGTKGHHSERANEKCVSLGPVDNLEEHVPTDWWRHLFNALYLKTDGDVVNDQKITDHEITQFSDILHLQKDQAVLDLCCGQGRHTLTLARRGFKNIQGIDQSAFLIRKARATARKESLPVQFKIGDARKLPYPPDSFDVVMILGNSFGYFENANEDTKVLKEIHRVLKPWGKLLLDLTDGEFVAQNFQPRSWEWIDKDYFVCRERSLSADRTRLICREIVSQVDAGVIADQFYAERLYTPDHLEKLLKSASFSDVNFQGSITPDSQRNQDLGMMECRLMTTAIVKKEWTPVKKVHKPGVQNVVVIMGDPKLRDSVKPDGVFDDDDIYTIDQLKAGLKDLKGYNFTFLTNHNTLISDLAKLKGKVDYIFNLCDEGFNNEARKELHIPSLLEIVGIPYTGAGPQCLAFCYDKSLVRGIAKEMGIPVPEGIFVKPDDTTYEVPFRFPVIVKPNFGDSSFGITQHSVVYNSESLLNAISEIRTQFGYDHPVLIEEYLTGNDISVGIIGNLPDSYQVLPITEEDYSMLPPGLPHICGYEAKWDPQSPYWQIKTIPARISDETKNYVIDSCLKLANRLEVRDYTRFDWRLDDCGNPKLLEVNPNPGWCWDGHLAKMARIAGMSYREMLHAILKATENRIIPANGNGHVNGNGHQDSQPKCN